jgi:hypothetical protein
MLHFIYILQHLSTFCSISLRFTIYIHLVVQCYIYVHLYTYVNLVVYYVYYSYLLLGVTCVQFVLCLTTTLKVFVLRRQWIESTIVRAGSEDRDHSTTPVWAYTHKTV